MQGSNDKFVFQIGAMLLYKLSNLYSRFFFFPFFGKKINNYLQVILIAKNL